MTTIIQPHYPIPGRQSLEKALNIIRNAHLHYYQLLFLQRPALTSPGEIGSPWNVTGPGEGMHTHTIAFTLTQHPEITFFINLWQMTQEMDEEIVRKCRALLQKANAIKQEHNLLSKHGQFPLPVPFVGACCPFAIVRDCVCYRSTICELHGTRCVGTHD